MLFKSVVTYKREEQKICIVIISKRRGVKCLQQACHITLNIWLSGENNGKFSISTKHACNKMTYLIFFAVGIGKANVGQNERSEGQNRGENSAKQRDPLKMLFRIIKTIVGSKKYISMECILLLIMLEGQNS